MTSRCPDPPSLLGEVPTMPTQWLWKSMVYHHTIVAPSHGNLIIEYVNKLKSLSSKLIPHISISKLSIPAFASNFQFMQYRLWCVCQSTQLPRQHACTFMWSKKEEQYFISTEELNLFTSRSGVSSSYFNPLQPRVAFLYPKGFLMFSGGIEKQHRVVMG